MTNSYGGVLPQPPISLGAGHKTYPQTTTPASGVNPRLSPSLDLYNADLAPTKRAGRTWKAYNIFTLWANDVHSLGNYAFVLALFAAGLGAWQILLALLVGAVFLFLLLSLSGFMGEKTGIPFPVMSRIAFGINGAQFAALLRGGVAVVWFGIQTYLASLVLRVMLIALAPGLEALDHDRILGLSALGWMSFTLLWVVQVAIVSYGMEMIRKYEAIAGPIILFTMIALAIWILVRVDGKIAMSIDNPLTGIDMWTKILGGGALWVAIYGTFVLNFCDFTRSAASRKSIILGNFWGIPVNMVLFGLIVVIMAGGNFKIDGQIINTPSDVVNTLPNVLLLVLACLALLILTVAVNLMANFVAPVYALTNLFPRHLNFRRAAFISAVIGFIILPWNLYDSPAVIEYFLGGLGALLGPLFGVIMADYWLVRRQQVHVPDLYSSSEAGTYYYTKGVNLRALYALVPAAVVALMLAFIPSWHYFANFSWFAGAGMGAFTYMLIADRKRYYEDVDGESIAVGSSHH